MNIISDTINQWDKDITDVIFAGIADINSYFTKKMRLAKSRLRHLAKIEIIYWDSREKIANHIYLLRKSAFPSSIQKIRCIRKRENKLHKLINYRFKKYNFIKDSKDEKRSI
jgi:hypothetical protein